MHNALKGFIFDIQHYSIHDGPGIRTTVFLSGCPLRCLWCQNPESQQLHPQLFFNYDKCMGCGRCIAVCPQRAVTLDRKTVKTNRWLCNICGECVKVCPQEARTIIGKEITATEVFKEVASDKIFYQDSNGGVTLSGGEVLSQPDFSSGILEMCKNDGIHTAIETCGYGSWENLRRILNYTDLVLFDFKHMDDAEHKKLTGVSNKIILKNAKRIWNDLKKPIIARLPVIPGYNDSTMNISQTAEFIAAELDISITVNLLPYHGLGEGKLKSLEQNRKDFSVTAPSDEQTGTVKKIIESYGLSVKIGG
jgi:pyruvate formate lyase activating enzyme